MWNLQHEDATERLRPHFIPQQLRAHREQVVAGWRKAGKNLQLEKIPAGVGCAEVSSLIPPACQLCSFCPVPGVTAGLPLPANICVTFTAPASGTRTGDHGFPFANRSGAFSILIWEFFKCADLIHDWKACLSYIADWSFTQCYQLAWTRYINELHLDFIDMISQ